jgi:HEAT repeat protein
MYAGKRVSQWLDAGYEDAAMALQEIGPAAEPYILARVAREDSRYGTLRRYQALWIKLPAFVRAAVPRPQVGNFDELRACSALLEVGSRVIPPLSIRLNDKNPAVRIACARALGCFRQRGSNIRAAFPALSEALRDPNPEVKALAAFALSM